MNYPVEGYILDQYSRERSEIDLQSFPWNREHQGKFLEFLLFRDQSDPRWNRKR